MSYFSKFQEFSIKSIWLFFVLFWLGTIVLAVKKFGYLWLALPMTVLVILIYFLLYQHSIHLSLWITIPILIVMTILPRLAWILNVQVIPASDFETYFKLASLMSEGQIGYNSYIARYPHVITYPFVLSWLFRITGPSLFCAQMLNVFFSLCTVILVFFIVRKIANPSAGFLAAVIITLWPSQIFYITLVSTEALYTFLQTACLILIIYLPEIKNSRLRWVAYFLLGTLLGVVNSVRPQAVLLMIGLVIFPLVFSKIGSKKIWLQRVLVTGVLIFGFSLSSLILNRQIEETIGMQTGSNLGYSLLTGSNPNSFGTYNLNDANYSRAVFTSVSDNVEEWNRIVLSTAVERISSNPMHFLKIQVMKNFVMWQLDPYGVQWNVWTLDPKFTQTETLIQNQQLLERISNVYYLSILFSCILTGILGIARADRGWSLLIVIWIIGFILSFVFLEVQSRYHYHVLPLFAILMGCGMAWSSEVIQSWKSIKSKSHM